jgi:hypothetical protein
MVMIPHQVTLQGRAIEVLSHVKYTFLSIKEQDMATMHGKNTCGDDVQFMVFGRDTIRRFRKKFRPGDTVNLVTEGGVIRRISKGIDLEV